MKRLVSLFTAILMLATVFAIPVSADSSYISAAITDAKVAYTRGESIEIIFSSSYAEPSDTFGATFSFDDAVFALDASESKSNWILTGGLGTINASKNQGAYAILGESTDLSGDILKLTFDIADDAPFGESEIDCEIIVKKGATVLVTETVNVTVTVSCLDHDWVEKADAKYKDDDATCYSYATYFKSCDICGVAHESDTFESGSYADHKYGDWEKADNDNHIRYCENYDECNGSETSAHTWDAGEVTTPPTCCDEGEKTYTCTATGCGATKTEVVDPTGEHTYGDWYKVDENTHKRDCTGSTCEAFEIADHTWDAGEVTTPPTCCDEGEKTYTCTATGCGDTYTEVVDPTGEHTYGDWYQVDENTHKRDCTGTNCEAFETADHDWTSVCDEVCDTCGHTRTVTHEYAIEWSKNSSQHWHSCVVCGNRTDVEDHIYDGNTCLACGHKKVAPNQILSGYIYVNETYHMILIGNGVITTEHIIDANGDCILCKGHIKDMESEDEIVVEVEDPVEPSTEEEEDVTVDVEEPADVEEENPKTGLSLGIAGLAVAAAAIVASKRR